MGAPLPGRIVTMALVRTRTAPPLDLLAAAFAFGACRYFRLRLSIPSGGAIPSIRNWGHFLESWSRRGAKRSSRPSGVFPYDINCAGGRLVFVDLGCEARTITFRGRLKIAPIRRRPRTVGPDFYLILGPRLAWKATNPPKFGRPGPSVTARRRAGRCLGFSPRTAMTSPDAPDAYTAGSHSRA